MAEDLKKNVNPDFPVVLISPLDWGMGHTTRCIPVIKALTNLSCSILIACNTAQQEIFLKEFPDVPIFPLNGYNISYRKGKLGTLLKIILQIPKILTSIKEERQFLENFMVDHEVDIIISDNRYGLFHPNAFSVIMTHQLGLKSGLGQWADKQAQRQLNRFISLFDLCLVPDQKEPDSLAGELSNPDVLPTIPVKYIGPLTRFSRKVANPVPPELLSGSHSRKILVILSGPEPQRSVLEEKILRQIKNLAYDFTIVRGIGSPQSVPKNYSGEYEVDKESAVSIINYADSEQLEKLIDENDLVICRSGYSSVMDLLVKRKRTIMIPTPGQGEQEYLAKKLAEKGYIITATQKKLNLEKLIQKAQQHSYKEYPFIQQELSQALKEIIALAAAKKSGLTFAQQTV